MMKRYFFLLMVLSGLAMLAGCQKEEDIPQGAILLTSESFNGQDTKTSVLGESVQWENGDKVFLNGTEYPVTVSNGKAYIVDANSSLSFPIIGYSEGFTLNNDATAVIINSTYNCHFSNGRQVIKLPMVAYAPSQCSTLCFMHLTAAVRVLLKNNTNDLLELDRVLVSSANQQLSGSAYISVNEGGVTITKPNVLGNTGGMSEVRFAEGTYIRKYVGEDDIVEVQVPILPIAEGSLTITVNTHVAGTPATANTYVFTHTASNSALARNEMMTARINISPTSDHVAVNRNGRFTVAEGQQVYFSKGNLRCTKKNSAQDWSSSNYSLSFFSTQYGTYETDEMEIAGMYNGHNEVGLFNYGCSGYNEKPPYSTDRYRGGLNDLTGTNYDWGIYNPISNGGDVAGMWRTLSQQEWDYLLNTRTTTSPRYGFYTVRFAINFARSGMVIYPDNYSGTVPSDNTIDDFSWRNMEAAGCVFLPNAGYRVGNNTIVGGFYYWTSTHYDENQSAYCVTENSGTCVTDDHHHRDLGLAVRLVQDVGN